MVDLAVVEVKDQLKVLLEEQVIHLLQLLLKALMVDYHKTTQAQMVDLAVAVVQVVLVLMELAVKLDLEVQELQVLLMEHLQ
jgi:hypothetical protein